MSKRRERLKKDERVGGKKERRKQKHNVLHEEETQELSSFEGE